MKTGIVLKDLTKTYPGTKTPALDRLSLQVAPGEIYGYLGANGAGKSTTIRLLLNFIQPTKGTATINDLDSVKDTVKIKKDVGYLAGDIALYGKATGKQTLDYLLRLQGVSDTTYRDVLIERFGATLNKPIADLSKGNRQKIGIIQACMHEPSVLILDEPTSGLDPLMQEAFYETMREAKARGAAVLMSSHNLAEAQSVCDRIGIIKHGRLIHEQSIKDADSLSKTIFNITLGNAEDVSALRASPEFTVLDDKNTTVRLRAEGTLRGALTELGQFEILNIVTEQLSLEDEFIKFYEDKS